MEIKKRYFQKYLHDIAIDQITEEYVQKGYQIFKEERLGKKYRADLVARKGEETIVFEVKSGKMSPEKKTQIKELSNYVRNQENYKFLVAIATPPKDKKLQVANIEDLLTQNMNDDLPSDLDALSTHTRLQEVTDVDIDEITINGNSIFVAGDGVISVELQFGSDGDQNHGDGFKSQDSFPFDFEITLEFDENYELKITEVDKLEIDTSSYDE